MSSQGSRLTQIQMRYQQKVMHENAQKKSDMYGSGYEDTQKLLTSSLGAGKVRAMFDERRNRAGIDKSYLLEPIAVESNKPTKRQVIGPASKASTQRITNYSKVIVPPLQNRNSYNHDINGNNNYYRNAVDDLIDRTQRPGETTVVNLKIKQPGTKMTPNIGVKKPSPTAVSSSSVGTTSSPLKNVTNQKSNPMRSMKSNGNSASSTSSVRSVSNAVKVSNGNSVMMQTRKQQKPSSPKSQNSQDSYDEVDDAPVPEGLVRCQICKRNFAEDRLEKHQTICQKTKAKKRKVYDASKKRVQGTEAESYLRKPLSAARTSKTNAVQSTPPKSANWRVKHEDFIKTIRAAKQMQAYVAKGGKLSDLPPPPPSENPDYVQCPHCSRRFNEAAASRHIPICQNINKPKPKATGLTSKNSSFAKRR